MTILSRRQPNLICCIHLPDNIPGENVTHACFTNCCHFMTSVWQFLITSGNCRPHVVYLSHVCPAIQMLMLEMHLLFKKDSLPWGSERLPERPLILPHFVIVAINSPNSSQLIVDVLSFKISTVSWSRLQDRFSWERVLFGAMREVCLWTHVFMF